MHSSRMRTTRLLTASKHALRRGMSAGGGSARGGVYPVNRMTDRCKNIILLRGVTRYINSLTDGQVQTLYLCEWALTECLVHFLDHVPINQLITTLS